MYYVDCRRHGDEGVGSHNLKGSVALVPSGAKVKISLTSCQRIEILESKKKHTGAIDRSSSLGDALRAVGS